MSYILLIESSTHVCSVALAQDGKVIAIREDFEEKSHASLLAVFADEVMKEGGIVPSQLNAIAVSKGPGSYTGLRIGVSTAKGLAYALDIPIIAIGTLRAMAHGFLSRNLNLTPPNHLVVSTIDARRMEVYSAIYNTEAVKIRATEAQIIDADSFLEYKNQHTLHIIGTGAAKCLNVVNGEHVFIYPEFVPSAAFLCQPAFEAFKNKAFEDLAYFEPFYLKDFIATIPRKNVIG